jgi:hypothetical protein
MGKVVRKLRTALVTSPAVGWTWHWVMEKPS